MTPTERMLLEALKPFAAASDACDDPAIADHLHAWESPQAMAVTIGDFRKARSAITAAEASPPLPDAGLRKALEVIAAKPLQPGEHRAGSLGRRYNTAIEVAREALSAVPGEGRRAVDGWQPIESAPRDGQHILVGVFGSDAGNGFGWSGPRDPATGIRAVQSWQDVALWIDDPQDPGFYSSSRGVDQERPFDALTHWMPLPPSPQGEGEAP